MLLPEGAKILSAHSQTDRNLRIWVLVHPYNKKIRRVIEIYGTGDEVPADPPPEGDGHIRVFCGTVLLYGGDFVLHVFERP